MRVPAKVRKESVTVDMRTVPGVRGSPGIERDHSPCEDVLPPADGPLDSGRPWSPFLGGLAGMGQAAERGLVPTAATLIGVQALYLPELLVEIEAIAEV